MSKKTDYDYIAKLEKAIKEKYGSEAILNPKSRWDDEKELKFIKEMKEFYKKQSENRKSKDREECNGFFISKNAVSKDTATRTCPVCEEYSFKSKDDLYMNKFQCCHLCYIQYVEHREDRWQTGWRPKVNN